MQCLALLYPEEHAPIFMLTHHYKYSYSFWHLLYHCYIPSPTDVILISPGVSGKYIWHSVMELSVTERGKSFGCVVY